MKWRQVPSNRLWLPPTPIWSAGPPHSCPPTPTPPHTKCWLLPPTPLLSWFFLPLSFSWKAKDTWLFCHTICTPGLRERKCNILLIKMYMVCSASILAIRIAHLKGQLDVIEGQGEGLQAEQYRRPETIYQMKVRIQRYHLQKAKCKMMWENRFPVRYEDNFDNNLFARILTDFERTRTR